ncbi:YggL family protein [Acidovorax sp. JHL-9]|uniref:YggL family protein n=1 Tax=Acidovorax sp. JHL-9 TaxID=1276756 RepID=UPI0003FB8B19|nr:YggL family protein [Acidovorax sp. JHL-9]
MSLPSNKQRSRRLRKKMRVGEFQELGFEYELKVKQALTPEQEEALMNRFLTELILPRNLAASGWVREGFVMAYLRGSTTEGDRQATQAWLAAQPEVAEVTVSALKDAWYVEN